MKNRKKRNKNIKQNNNKNEIQELQYKELELIRMMIF